MSWSVRDLLDFSYIPNLNEAFEGTWAHVDPLNVGDLDTINESSEITTINSDDSDSL